MRICDIHWLAGLYEGEGCFSVDKGRYPRMYLRMTDRDVVERAGRILGIGSINKAKPGPLGKKSTWCYQINAESAGVMMMLYPLMGERRQGRIREVLAIWRATPRTKPWKSGQRRRRTNGQFAA